MAISNSKLFVYQRVKVDHHQQQVFCCDGESTDVHNTAAMALKSAAGIAAKIDPLMSSCCLDTRRIRPSQRGHAMPGKNAVFRGGKLWCAFVEFPYGMNSHN